MDSRFAITSRLGGRAQPVDGKLLNSRRGGLATPRIDPPAPVEE
jgi:hypothetical protein